MQSVSSRIWTHVAVSISNDVNHYTIINCWILTFERDDRVKEKTKEGIDKYLDLARELKNF